MRSRGHQGQAVDVGVLGSLQVQVGGELLALGGARRRALLALLLVEAPASA
jgi:DNA-binding SARP family transcriptional activator